MAFLIPNPKWDDQKDWNKKAPQSIFFHLPLPRRLQCFQSLVATPSYSRERKELSFLLQSILQRKQCTCHRSYLPKPFQIWYRYWQMEHGLGFQHSNTYLSNFSISLFCLRLDFIFRKINSLSLVILPRCQFTILHFAPLYHSQNRENLACRILEQPHSWAFDSTEARAKNNL